MPHEAIYIGSMAPEPETKSKNFLLRLAPTELAMLKDLALSLIHI